MRISSNKISALLDFYQTELKSLHDQSEIDTLFSIATEHYLNIPKKELNKKLDENLNHSDVLKIYDCCKALRKNIPIQYVLGEAWFLDLKYKVNTDVLIPRPETEEMVDKIIKENPNAKSFLDIGTGSGCIPIAIKSNIPDAIVSAVDISEAALKLAKTNAILHRIKINFIKADVLASDTLLSTLPDSFDVIVSNPPYIQLKEKESLEKQVLGQEPHLALFVEGEDPIIFYKKIINLCNWKLNAGGNLYFELNPLTANEVETYAKKSSLFESIRLIKDMSGKLRFLKATRQK